MSLSAARIQRTGNSCWPFRRRAEFAGNVYLAVLKNQSIINTGRYMKRILPILLVSAACFFSMSLVADEGMYPLSMIQKLDLKKKGLKIDIKEIYNPKGVSLIDAICEVGGGTGEFVSADGLILTNHHIAFTAVTAASTAERDYLKNGFTAPTRAEEIPAKDYVCRITEDYEDVSSKILEGISAETPPVERNKLIIERMNSLAKQKHAGRQNIECEVSEMYPGKSYVLFTYRMIRDVRLVYVPPIGIGEFGGENDNWIWPRHTGDFSFMRAYVAPDGSTADYSENNIPFKPKKFLRINPSGVNEGDFVMILGYPGRTYRHKTSHYLSLHQTAYLPFISKHFDWLIARMEQAGENDRSIQLLYADDIKSYANTTKNFKGKVQGMRRLELVAQKAAEEAELQKFIDSDPARKAKYGSVLADLKNVYDKAGQSMRQETAARLMPRTSGALQLAGMAMGAVKIDKSDSKRRTEIAAEMKDRLQKMVLPVEKDILMHWLAVAASLPKDESAASIQEKFSQQSEKPSEEIRTWVENAFASSQLMTPGGIDKLTAMTAEEFRALDDPIVALVRGMAADADRIQERLRERSGTTNRLEAELLDVKMMWKSSDFIPDANSTLRLTYGYVRGYSPADATYAAPMTSLRGIIEKNTGEDPYDAPQKLVELYKSKKYDKRFEAKSIGDVPVAFLYNMDTTGGNSGSPILDAYGRLVGVNFDRTYEATINDYQWSESYSRSIGADIRYVLFVAKYVGGADFLLRELGVNM